MILGVETPNPLVALLWGVGVLFLGLALFWPKGGLIGRRRRLRQLSERILREHALKHIATAELDGQPSTIHSLAGALEVSASRATEALADLERRRMVVFHGSEARLTPTGREYGLQVIRAHRLWERYLADTTGLSEAEWHRKADRMEHVLTPGELSEFSDRLGNPTHDPHGDPIPTATGELVKVEGILLNDAPVGQLVRIVHIEDEPETVYTQIVAEDLHPGTILRVLERTPRKIRFWAEGGEHVLAPILASSVTVAPLPDAYAEREAERLRTTLRLSDIRPGQKARVLALSSGCRGPERRRLLDLGFVKGTIVEIDLTSPVGDPTAYRVRGAVIALRREQASLIHVAAMEEVPV